MNRSTRRVGALLLALVALTAVTAGVGFADDRSSGLVVDDHVETTPQTVTVENTNFTASSVARVNAGEPLTTHITGPRNVTGVRLLERDGAVVAEREASVNDSVTFDTANLTPGEYVLTSHDNDVFLDAYPVVVTAYETSLSVQGSATDERNVTFSVTTAKTTDTAPEIGTVEIVVRGPESLTRLTATETENNTYTAKARLGSSGYQAYAVVYAENDENGLGERVGLSNSTNATTGTQSEFSPVSTPERKRTAEAGDAPTDQFNVNLSNLPAIPRLLSGQPVGMPAILVGLFVGGLAVSTVVYQTVYTIRQR